MKITIDLVAKILLSATDLKFVKNSENVFPAYIYGVSEGYNVKVTYTKPDRNIVGPMGCIYMDDPDGLPCYYTEVPEVALTVKGDIGISVGVYSDPAWSVSTLAFWTSRGIVDSVYDIDGSDSTDLPDAPSNETAARVYVAGSNSYLYYVSTVPCVTLPKTTGYILDTDVVQVPKELETTVSDLLNLAVNNLQAQKASLAELAAEIAKVVSGTTVAGKATKDAAGNTIVTHYAPKTDVDAKLPLVGGAMLGPIAMGGFRITGLLAGAAAGDVTCLSQVQTLIAAAIAAVYKYRGKVAAFANLPTTGMVVGDVYDVEDDGTNYAWDGTGWDDIGGIGDGPQGEAIEVRVSGGYIQTKYPSEETWTNLVALSTLIGPQGAPFTNQGEWDKDTHYYNDESQIDLVRYGGKVYSCLETIITADNDNPEIDTTTWMLFAEISMEVDIDAASQAISYTLINNQDMTFSHASPTSVAIIIPATADQGFSAGINFNSGASAPTVSFTNNSGYTLKIISYGRVISSYTPTASRAVNMIIYCEGLNIYCRISEVE